MQPRPVTSRSKIDLSDRAAASPDDAPTDEKLERLAEKAAERIGDRQKVLYADGRHALLVVLQGRDASGKDGAIKRVFREVNPQGIAVTSFKKPTDDEASHDFLWRVHNRVPARGMIGVFNRSHYEDVLVPRVLGSIDKAECARRYQAINDFERSLSESGVVIRKFFLHMSRDEQKKQLKERLADHTKNWKFNSGDLDARASWDDYTAAYRDAIRATSSRIAPWYVVPADSKRFRNWYVADVIADTLERMDLRYPKLSAKVRRMKIV